MLTLYYVILPTTSRHWSYDMVSTGLWDHLREVYKRDPPLFTSLAQGNSSPHVLLLCDIPVNI